MTLFSLIFPSFFPFLSTHSWFHMSVTHRFSYFLRILKVKQLYWWVPLANAVLVGVSLLLFQRAMMPFLNTSYSENGLE